MPNRLCYLILVLMLCISSLPVMAVQLQEAPYIDVDVQEPPLCGVRGYREYQLNITNSSDRAHEVEIIAAGSGVVSRLTRTVEIAPRTSLTVPIYQPSVSFYCHNLTVNVNGKYAGPVPINFQAGDYNDTSDILVSNSLPQTQANYRQFFSDFETRSQRSYETNGRYIGRFLLYMILDPIENWSTNWIAYSSYQAIILSANEYLNAPEKVASALNSYVETGGVLILVGSVPAEKIPDQTKTSFGTSSTRGFGMIYTVNDTDVQNWSVTTWADISSCWSGNYNTNLARYMNNPNTAENEMPVTGPTKIPVNLLFAVVLVFAVLVGPVNIFVFARGNKRMRVYWIVPLCSVVATAIIISVSLFAEGITAKVRTMNLVYLDENNHRASSTSRMGYYCPIPPGYLEFDNTIQVNALSIRNSWSYGDDRQVDYTNGQTYIGWVSARVPTHFYARQSQTSRSRLNLRYDDKGNLSVVNGLEADIEQLWLADSDGAIYQAQNLVIGQSIDLEKTDKNVDKSTGPNTFRRDFRYNKVTLENSISQALTEGTYVALLKSDPFIQVGFEDYVVTEQDTVVFGILNKQSLRPSP